MRSPPGSVMMLFAPPDPATTFATGGLDVWADAAASPNGNATSDPTNARRPRRTLTMPTSRKDSLRRRSTPKPRCVRDSNGDESLDFLERRKVSTRTRAVPDPREDLWEIRKASNRLLEQRFAGGCGNWLGGRDSNPDNGVQSAVSYR